MDAIRTYSQQYVSNLPNFICTQVIHQFEAGVGAKHWRKNDTLTNKLSYSEGRERRTLELVNDKSPKRGKRLQTPLITEGEFGSILSRLFDPASEASFSWSGWETMRRKRVAVFTFFVAQEHSSLRLSLNDREGILVAYDGFLYADPENGTVYRVKDKALRIPAVLQTRSIGTTVDYDEVAIGDKKSILPVQATVELGLWSSDIRNEMEFRDYRKFEADSTITFDTK